MATWHDIHGYMGAGAFDEALRPGEVVELMVGDRTNNGWIHVGLLTRRSAVYVELDGVDQFMRPVVLRLSGQRWEIQLAPRKSRIWSPAPVTVAAPADVGGTLLERPPAATRSTTWTTVRVSKLLCVAMAIMVGTVLSLKLVGLVQAYDVYVTMSVVGVVGLCVERVLGIIVPDGDSLELKVQRRRHWIMAGVTAGIALLGIAGFAATLH